MNILAEIQPHFIQLKPFKVTLDCEGCPTFDAFYDPTNKRWNGWENPYFDKANRDKFIEWTRKTSGDDIDHINELKSIKPTLNGLYYFGSSIVWEEA
tara:strand:- start:70 stop:360 length:291 start_codon:yes stop_codon:yes gene_type:complete